MPSENLSMRVKDDFDRILKEEIIETQDLLINVMLDVLNGVLKKTIGETVNTNEIMQQFLESFTTKKIKNYQLLEKQTAEIRIISKKWSDKFDNTETSFEKFMKILEGVETSFIQKVENEERLSEAIHHFEQVCTEKDHQSSTTNQALQEELKILRNQNLPHPKNSQNQDFKAQTSDLEYQNYDSFSKHFIHSFSHKVKQYSGNVDYSNRDQLLTWLKNLILKMENDNKWL
jgi:recombination DNA repair RAD52 pathway protein